MGARLILVEGYIQSSPEKVTHLVASDCSTARAIWSALPMTRSPESMWCRLARR